MREAFNSNGNGTSGLQLLAKKKVTSPSSSLSGVKENVVIFQIQDGVTLRGQPTRVTRHAIFFELYNSTAIPRLSEVLESFKIIFQEQTIYEGRAIILSIFHSGNGIVCEASLDEAHWVDVDLESAIKREEIMDEFKTFIREWQKLYKVSPAFKVIVADMQIFFQDLRLWLERKETGDSFLTSGERTAIKQETMVQLGDAIVPVITNFFEKFEKILQGIDKDLEPVHRVFSRRILHPLLLCSPFLYRTFAKPLGYAGDYEMVNMIMRDPFEGDSLYAKIINLWFVNQAPAEAHRNRIDYLCEHIATQAAHAFRMKKKARILTLGCGPAHEVQKFLRENPIPESAAFFLLDFNSETLARTGKILENLKKERHYKTPIYFIKKSVNQILKEASKVIKYSADQQYDLVYCAGLFDYLTDPVCKSQSMI